MGFVTRYIQSLLSRRKCPACGASWVDAEISEAMKQFCEPGAFHSRLIGGRDPETGKIEYWQCPDCKEVFTPGFEPVIHTMSEVFLDSK